jgi:hypothetical protein
MEAMDDLGVQWRQEITPFLQNLGVTVLDPCDKPTDVVTEDQERWVKDRAAGKFDQLTKDIHLLRCVDLRMVDVADFIIVNLNNDIRTCGTWEEIFLANRQKKPVIFHLTPGKLECPLWLFGTFPHQMMFDNWCDVRRYLVDVNFDRVPSLGRWLLFDFEGH